MKNNKVAIMYDFDKTLCTKDSPEYEFIPNLNMEADDFWKETENMRKIYKTDQVLSYMYVMREKMLEQGKKLSREYLNDMGKKVEFFPGVLEWFDRISEYGKILGLEVEHYIISSGLKEIIEGSPISDKFKCIFASEYFYDEDGNAIWPNLSVNYTNKTQYLTRINKGILDLSDNRLNNKMEQDDKRISNSNMIYIGDGFTDVPCMQVTKDRGGISIAVYTPENYNVARNLFEDGRINYMAPTDYSLDGKIDTIVKGELNKIALSNGLYTLNQ